MRISLDYMLNSGAIPRFHPNGFIQLNLNKDGSTRFHVWPEPGCDLKKQESDNTIHDHIFDMESRVLHGKLTNVAYEFNQISGIHNPSLDDIMFEVYSATYPTPKEDSMLHKTGEIGMLDQIDRVTMISGSEYLFRAFQFHDSIPHGLTATVMHKTRIHEGSNPRVLCRYGTIPDVAFSRFSQSEEVMWAQIRKVMAGHIFWFEVPDEHIQA